MKKFFYYVRLVTFIAYLIMMFLLINKLYRSNIIEILYFIFNAIYAMIIILTMLSKKKTFINNISYNILNISLYTYTFIMFYMVFDATSLEIIANEKYFHHNYIMLIILIGILIFYTLLLNFESEKNDNS